MYTKKCAICETPIPNGQLRCPKCGSGIFEAEKKQPSEKVNDIPIKFSKDEKKEGWFDKFLNHRDNKKIKTISPNLKKSTYNITRLESWGKFAGFSTAESITGNPKPQLCLDFKIYSMAEAFVKYRPTESDSLMRRIPDLIKFTDGSGATHFFLHNGEDILKLFDILLNGQNYGERVVITNGFVVNLPSSHQPHLSSILKSLGWSSMTSFGGKSFSW